MLIKAPLIWAGEVSEIYKGDVMDVIPTPNPTKIRPITTIDGNGATAITNEPMKNSTSAVRIAFFRPKLSFIQAPIAAPMIAAATDVLTINSCNHVCLSTDLKSSRIYNKAPEITAKENQDNNNIYINHNEIKGSKIEQIKKKEEMRG